MTLQHPLLRRLFALLGLLSLLAVVVLRGRPYVRCSLDGILHFTACCQAAHWDDGQAFDDPACCEHLPRADLAPAELPAPLQPDLGALALAPLPSPSLDFAPLSHRAVSFPAPLPSRPPARAPPPPSTARRLARLARLLS